MFTATKDMMLPGTVTGSWPRPRWYTANMWGRPLDTAMMDPWFRERFTDAHAQVTSDQERAGLDILTTGDYHLDEDVAVRSWHYYDLDGKSVLQGVGDPAGAQHRPAGARPRAPLHRGAGRGPRLGSAPRRRAVHPPHAAPLRGTVT